MEYPTAATFTDRSRQNPVQRMVPKSFSEEAMFIECRGLLGEERDGETVTRQ